MKRLFLSLVEDIVGSEGEVLDLGNVFVAKCDDGFWTCDKDVELRSELGFNSKSGNCEMMKVFYEEDVVFRSSTKIEIERFEREGELDEVKIVRAELAEKNSVNSWKVTERQMIADGMRDGRLESMAGAFDEVQVYEMKNLDSDLYAGLHKGFTL
jgi:hypothetical protein